MAATVIVQHCDRGGGGCSGMLHGYANAYRLNFKGKGLVRIVLKHALLVLSASGGVGFAVT